VVAASTRLLGASSARTARSRVALADALVAAGQRGDGETAQALPVLRAQLAADSPLLRRLAQSRQ